MLHSHTAAANSSRNGGSLACMQGIGGGDDEEARAPLPRVHLVGIVTLCVLGRDPRGSAMDYHSD